MKESELKKYLRPYIYEDERVTRLLNSFDDHVRFIRNYDENFQLDDATQEQVVLAGYRNTAFGILLSLFQLGHLTTMDFHMRMHALNSAFFAKVAV